MILSRYCKLYHWPAITCTWFTITFVTSYLVSVLGGNVYALFPYISDTGALPPESCIFGQLLNIGALLMVITMYIRYRQVDISINSQHIDLNPSWNTASIVLGSLACLGMSFVANFQETAAGEMHFVGAILAYGIGIVYFYVQTRISFAYRNISNKSWAVAYRIRKFTLYLRTFLAVCMLPLFIANLVCATLSVEEFTGETIVWWTEEDGGFQLRLGGSFTEWILTIFIFAYIASFTNEFKVLEYKGIDFGLKNLDVPNNIIQMV